MKNSNYNQYAIKWIVHLLYIYNTIITKKQNAISCEIRPIILKLTKSIMIIKFVHERT
jgi:hypothetical protein